MSSVFTSLSEKILMLVNFETRVIVYIHVGVSEAFDNVLVRYFLVNFYNICTISLLCEFYINCMPFYVTNFNN